MAGYYDRDRRARYTGGDDNFDTTHPAGTMNYPMSHHNNATEYMSSGIPFVFTKRFQATDFTTANAAGHAGATVQADEICDKLAVINFPYVTRWVMVWCHWGTDYEANTQNDAADIRIGFGYAGSTYNASEGGPVIPAVTANTAGEGNWVTSGICNQVRLELKTKKMHLMIPGYYSSADQNHGAKGSRLLTVEIIAGLTNVKDFPNQNSPYVSGVTSTQYDGYTGELSGNGPGSDDEIDSKIHDPSSDVHLTTVSGGAAFTQ